MNGATTEPLVRINSPPNRIIITKIGNSQYFLRTRVNNHISPKNDAMAFRGNWLRDDSVGVFGGTRRALPLTHLSGQGKQLQTRPAIAIALFSTGSPG